MTILPYKFDKQDRQTVGQAGHTLVEMMFASGILVMVVLALLAAHLAGLRENQLVQSKSGASDASRLVLSQLPKDIRSAKTWNIGNIVNTTNFVAVTNGALQGNALQLCQTTNGTQFSLYFFDLADINNSNGVMKRASSSGGWNPVVLASNLISSLYFTAEDYNGVTQTNSGAGKSYKGVIHVTLQFCQFQYPRTVVGTNGLYDFYKLEFRATPHLPE